MYQGTNPAALRSQKKIIVAFNQSLTTHKLQEITIKDLMNQTGLSRPTFYKAFDSIDEIITYQLDQLFNAYISDHSISEVTDLCSAATLFFDFFAQNETFVRLIVTNGKTCLLQQRCDVYLNNDHFLRFIRPQNTTDKETTLIVSFITSGIIGLTNRWLDHPKQYTPSELANLVCRLTNNN